jgi:hypothetical protein
MTNPKVGGWENLIWIDVQAPVNGLDVTSGVMTVEISRSIFRFELFEHTTFKIPPKYLRKSCEITPFRQEHVFRRNLFRFKAK